MENTTISNNVDDNIDIAKKLRKKLKKTKFNIANGSTVRWTQAGRFYYVAIFVDGTWYTTGGNYYVEKTYTEREFLLYLSESVVSDVQMAIDWIAIG